MGAPRHRRSDPWLRRVADAAPETRVTLSILSRRALRGPALKHCLVRLPLLILLLGQPAWLRAQVPSPLSLIESKSTEQPRATQPLEDLAAERARVDSHLREASTQLTEANQVLGAPAAEQSDEDTKALQERIDLLQGRIQIARRHLEIVDEATAIREEKAQVEIAIDSWTGFADPPPYPLDLSEELAKALKQHQAAIKVDELRLASFTQGQALAEDELASAEKTFRQTLEALESARTDEAKAKARRQHELSQLALQLSGESVAFVRSSEQLFGEKLALNRLRAELARNKLKPALQDVRLASDEVQARIGALGKELTGASAILAKLNASETAASQRLEKLREPLDAQKANGDVDPVLDLERQLRQEQLAAIRATEDDVNLRIGYIQLHQQYWKRRLELHEHWDFARARTELTDIATYLAVIEQGISAFDLVQAETADFAVQERFAAPELAGPRRALLDAIKERSTQLAATLSSARRLHDFLALWKQEIEVRAGDLGVAKQVKAWDDVFVDELQRLWSFELLSVEDTLVVDGQRMVEKRPVTIGKAIEAVLILGIGLPLASGLARLISRILLPFSAAAWQRRLLLQKLLRVGMIALVVVLALATVKIPLAVFAFLGGAIALGIGFGAKNLLNNFISGFILLGEGTIRSGDWVEIDGTRGIVQRIGERSTRVRCFDGVHLLIPNSHFLESSVTNLTLADRRMRVSIQVGVAYGSPTRQVEALLLDIAKANALVVADPAPVVVFEDFGDSSLVFRLYVWIDLEAQPDYRAVVTELRHCIGERFAESGYVIAFPQQDVHLRHEGPLLVQVSSPSPDVATTDPRCR